MISAGMVTHTSIADFLNMTIKRFYQIYFATANVIEKRKNQGGDG